MVAVLLVVPVPFTNLAPSLAFTAYGLELARKDGVMALVGYGLVVASLAAIWLCLHFAIMAITTSSATFFTAPSA